MSQRQSCSLFASQFEGFYSPDFLSGAYFVVVEQCPKPEFIVSSSRDFDDFLNMSIDGVTYNDTYYIRSGCEDVLSLHFHELVHVVQWQALGVHRFIERYLSELRQHGYRHAPLEEMAYSLQAVYESRNGAGDIKSYVRQRL